MSESPTRGLVALVAYVPDPLAGSLYRLRSMLPGDYHPEPHITLLPPRPLSVDLSAACSTLESVLEHQPAFQVELSTVQQFAATNTLYFAVDAGSPELHALHASLNDGDLHHQEVFEFSPHVTIGGPVESASLTHLQLVLKTAWQKAGSNPRFLLDEVVCLHHPEGAQWQRVWTKRLLPPV